MSTKKLIPVFNIRKIAAHTDLIPVQEERYNFTLDITLCFSFDGTEAEAKEKLNQDKKDFEKIITEGMTGSGLEYAVVAGHIFKHHAVD